MAFRPGTGAMRPQEEDEEKTRFAPMDFGAASPRQPEPTIVNPIELSAQAPKPRPAAGVAPPAANPWADQPGQGITAAGAPAPPQPQYQGWGSVQVQPGVAPPGMMQPGMMQPGMMQPGMMQPGMMQPGMMQPGMMQPGVPPAMAQPGMMQPGTMQPGMMPGMPPGGMPPGMMPPGMNPGASGMLPAQGPPTETGKVITATGPTGLWERIKKDWQETSFIKKGMLVLMPLIGMLIYIEYGQEPPPPPPAPLAIADAGPATSTAGSAIAPVATGPAIAVPTTTGVIPISPIPAMPDGGIKFNTSADAGARTLERQAADAVQAGQFAKAIQIYDELAGSTQPGPQQDAYKAAASILRAKLDAGG
jgi:hypothetical protein